MIILKHLSQLDAANARAIKVNPPLKVIDFGVYDVLGSKKNWYRVTCKLNDAGQRIVFCSCEEGGRRRKNVPCYHMAPAVGAHLLLAQAKRSVLAFQITYPDGDKNGD